MAVRSSNRGRLSGGRHTPEKLVRLIGLAATFFCCCCYFGSSLAQLPPSRYASINDFPDLLLEILVVSYLNRLRAEKRITRLFRRTFFTAPAGVYFFSERKKKKPTTKHKKTKKPKQPKTNELGFYSEESLWAHEHQIFVVKGDVADICGCKNTRGVAAPPAF